MSQDNEQLQKQLEQLRDIHLPEPVGWFPPAIGWWVLAGLVVLAVAWFTVRWWKGRHGRAVMNSAMTEFDGLYGEYLKQKDSVHFAGQLSALIKRVGMYQDELVATLSCEDWADYLQKSGFEREQVEFIAFAPYASVSSSSGQNDNVDWDGLERSVRGWIRDRFKK